jgi:3-methyladenine DNA glycosylase AlkC
MPTGATSSPTKPPRRKGARRMSEIPPAVLRALNRGEEETITLVEWLAIDVRQLARAVVRELALGAKGGPVLDAADELYSQGVMARSRGMGAAWLAAAPRGKARAALLERLAKHRADVVRSWAAYSLAADAELGLVPRLAAARRFAADPHMAVRECAWDTIRPYLAADLEHGIALLRPWVRDRDPAVRRCAVEATRPRGVWCAHLEPLKREPELARPLLDPVRSDESLYVRRSVGNWLNDASKSQPAWVQGLCRRWRRESPTPETRWITSRGERTMGRAPAHAVRASRSR